MERKEMKYMIKIMPVLFLALMLAGPVSENDFYGYKRRTMAEYYHLAKLTGRL